MALDYLSNGERTWNYLVHWKVGLKIFNYRWDGNVVDALSFHAVMDAIQHQSVVGQSGSLELSFHFSFQ